MRRHVYFYTHLDVPFARASEALAHAPEVWLPDPATAEAGEWQVQLVAEGALPGPLARRLATVSVDPSASRAGMMLRGLRWHAAAADQLFPVLTADLELVALNGSGCHLSLMGSYRPPLAVVGEFGDRLLGHRIAEACVRRFVLDVAARLEG